MGFATSNQTAVRYVEESNFAETPASPVFKELRYTGESLNHNIETITSEEIRADRMTSDLIQVGAMNDGEVNLEMSYGSYDDLIEGAMAARWATTINVSGATDISVDSTSSIASGGTSLAGVPVGAWVKISGFTNAANNGYFQVTASTASSLDFVQTTLVVEPAGDSIDITGSSIKNGVTPISYTFQKYLQDATTPTWIQYLGCRVGSWDLSFDTAAILTGSFGIMGTSSTASSSAIAGQTIDPATPTTTEVMNAVNNVADIVIDGVPSTYYFSSLSLNVNNNLRAQQAIGSLPAINIALSRLSITGSIMFYFENKDQYDKYVNGSRLSLSFRVEDSAGNAYQITIPQIEFSSGSITAGGLDTDVFMEADWEAVLDPTTSCMIQVDRFPAA